MPLPLAAYASCSIGKQYILLIATPPPSFRMEGMNLLTGPNMAGKSTVQRATCAAVLLGLCGLTVRDLIPNP